MSEEVMKTTTNFYYKKGKTYKKNNKHFQAFDYNQYKDENKSYNDQVKVFKIENFPPQKYVEHMEEEKNNSYQQEKCHYDYSTPKKASEKYRSPSKDSDNYSTSNEDNANDYFQNSYQTSGSKTYHQEQFKSTAEDFKVKYKTELCKFFEINGQCKFGSRCAYAHGKEELRSKVAKTSAYRSRKCYQFFEKGYCPYGNRCQFAHALKSNIENNPYEKDMCFTKTLKTLSKMENIENIKSFPEKKRRLPIFESIVPSEHKDDKENSESSLSVEKMEIRKIPRPIIR